MSHTARSGNCCAAMRPLGPRRLRVKERRRYAPACGERGTATVARIGCGNGIHHGQVALLPRVVLGDRVPAHAGQDAAVRVGREAATGCGYHRKATLDLGQGGQSGLIMPSQSIEDEIAGLRQELAQLKAAIVQTNPPLHPRTMAVAKAKITKLHADIKALEAKRKQGH